MRRIEAEEAHVFAGLPAGLEHVDARNAIAAVDEGGGFDAASLPPDHPKWSHDGVSLSRRARALVARLAPIAVKVFTMWDHRFRAIGIHGRRLVIDPSGCYRFDG